jgi:peptide deformylase
MAVRKILTYPNPLLAEKSTDVDKVDDEIRTIMDDMIETMHDAPGIGLAAPQVGILKNIIVVDVSADEGEEEKGSCLIALINPCIIEREGSVTFEEGCLSVPDLLVKVKRSLEIVVKGLDRDGAETGFKCKGLSSVAVQHEIDHLTGTLITDYASHLKRSLYTKKLKKKEKAKKL